MSEFFYLKMFFTEFTAKKILSIKKFFQLNIITPIIFLFMDKLEKREYLKNQREKSIIEAQKLIKGIALSVAVYAVTSAVKSALNNEDKKP